MGWLSEHDNTLTPTSDVVSLLGSPVATAVPDALFVWRPVAPLVRFTATRDSILGEAGGGASMLVLSGQTVTVAVTPGEQYAIDASP